MGAHERQGPLRTYSTVAAISDKRLSNLTSIDVGIQMGSLAPHMKNFTLTDFRPVLPRCRNCEIITESMG
jgi:hypothetical protein